MDPYQERVSEIIKEEFSRQGIETRKLPDNERMALMNITRRIADDLTFVTQYNADIIVKLLNT